MLPCIYVPFKCNCVAILDRGRISFMHFGLKLKIRFAMVSIMDCHELYLPQFYDCLCLVNYVILRDNNISNIHRQMPRQQANKHQTASQQDSGFGRRTATNQRSSEGKEALQTNRLQFYSTLSPVYGAEETATPDIDH